MDKVTIEKRLDALKAELATAQGTPTEVYSRIVGYYRSVRNWNAGKRDEFNHRATFQMPSGVPSALGESAASVAEAGTSELSSRAPSGVAASYLLFARETCPNCPAVKEYLARSGLPGTVCDVDTPEGLERARGYGILASPTAVLRDAQGRELYRAFTVTELRAFLEPVAAAV